MTRRPRKPPRRAIPRLDAKADPGSFFMTEKPATGGFAEALENHLPDPTAHESPPSPPRPSGERLKNHPPPQGECDCHGLTAAEAEAAVRRFLAQADRAALRTVRIITGKGLHSPAGPVLRDVVEGELRLLRKKGAIVAFRWEKKEKEKSGSVLVYL
ncbi:MAG: Smr/MutS family protein [Thermodesulfobacteriota bacterium]